jgi:hypothetical protein
MLFIIKLSHLYVDSLDICRLTPQPFWSFWLGIEYSSDLLCIQFSSGFSQMTIDFGSRHLDLSILHLEMPRSTSISSFANRYDCLFDSLSLAELTFELEVKLSRIDCWRVGSQQSGGSIFIGDWNRWRVRWWSKMSWLIGNWHHLRIAFCECEPGWEWAERVWVWWQSIDVTMIWEGWQARGSLHHSVSKRCVSSVSVWNVPCF